MGKCDSNRYVAPLKTPGHSDNGGKSYSGCLFHVTQEVDNKTRCVLIRLHNRHHWHVVLQALIERNASSPRCSGRNAMPSAVFSRSYTLRGLTEKRPLQTIQTMEHCMCCMYNLLHAMKSFYLQMDSIFQIKILFDVIIFYKNLFFLY